jgi:hypothetical protein
MIATLIDLGIKAFGPPQHSQAVLVSPSSEMAGTRKRKGVPQEESGRQSQVRVAAPEDGSRGGIWGDEYLNQSTNVATAETEVMADVMAEVEESEEPSMVSDFF